MKSTESSPFNSLPAVAHSGDEKQMMHTRWLDCGAISQVWIVFVVCSVFFPQDACAYLDLTTGSYAAQAIFMLLATGGIVLKRWGKSIAAVVFKKKTADVDHAEK